MVACMATKACLRLAWSELGSTFRMGSWAGTTRWTRRGATEAALQAATGAHACLGLTEC